MGEIRILWIALLATLGVRAQLATELPVSWASSHYDEALKLVFPDPFVDQAIAKNWRWAVNARIMGHDREVQVIIKKPFDSGGSMEAYYPGAGLQTQLREMKANSPDLTVEAAAKQVEKRHCGPLTGEALVKSQLAEFSKLSINVAGDQAITVDSPVYLISIRGAMNTMNLEVGEPGLMGVSDLTNWLSSILAILRQKCRDIPDVLCGWQR